MCAVDGATCQLAPQHWNEALKWLLPPITIGSAGILEGSNVHTVPCLIQTSVFRRIPCSAERQQWAQSRPCSGAPLRPVTSQSWPTGRGPPGGDELLTPADGRRAGSAAQQAVPKKRRERACAPPPSSAFERRHLGRAQAQVPRQRVGGPPWPPNAPARGARTSSWWPTASARVPGRSRTAGCPSSPAPRRRSAAGCG